MPNVDSFISSHNRKILQTEIPNLCNCRNKNICPLKGKCLTQAVVYQAKISTDDGESFKYIGLSEPPFKTRRNDHRSSFNDRIYETKTDLSKKVWELRDQNKMPHITWSILKKSSPYMPGSDHCNLCLWEKFYIMKDKNLINTKDEFVSKCKHINKFLLRNYKKKDKKVNGS